YYDDPVLVPGKFGVAELEGLRNTRIYDPRTNTWTQTGETNIGRWYPTMVTLGNGKTLIAGGVQKLVKPIYPDRIEGSGTNVLQTETYDPVTGRWTDNGASAQHSLPLFPRLHLLPDGKVFYNGGGQVFSPAGEAYDEARWNLDAVYDPAHKSWTDVGIPGVGTAAPGFRGSTFSIMLPLAPPYTSASFLSAGGVLFPTPGSYVANPFSNTTTVDTANGDAPSTKATGNLNHPRRSS